MQTRSVLSQSWLAQSPFCAHDAPAWRLCRPAPVFARHTGTVSIAVIPTTDAGEPAPNVPIVVATPRIEQWRPLEQCAFKPQGSAHTPLTQLAVPHLHAGRPAPHAAPVPPVPLSSSAQRAYIAGDMNVLWTISQIVPAAQLPGAPGSW